MEPARLSKNGSGNNHVDDHPLNPNPESQWGSFFKDNEVLAQIDKDVRCVFQGWYYMNSVGLRGKSGTLASIYSSLGLCGYE